MTVDTRIFGKIGVEEDKIIRMENGIIGFPELKQFTLIFDSEKEERPLMMWLQSLDEPDVAFPVLVPIHIKPDYNPTVNEEMLKPLGNLTPENTYILVTVNVPKDIEKLAINLKAPFIINTDTNRGSQIIIEDNYPSHFEIYGLLKDLKERSGE